MKVRRARGSRAPCLSSCRLQVAEFDAAELELLLCGVPSLDVAQWRCHSVYRSGFSAQHPAILWLWDIITECGRPACLACLACPRLEALASPRHRHTRRGHVAT